VLLLARMAMWPPPRRLASSPAPRHPRAPCAAQFARFAPAASSARRLGRELRAPPMASSSTWCAANGQLDEKPSLLISHLVLPGSCERRRHSLPSLGRTDFSEDSSFLAGDEEARVAATLPSSPGPLLASCFSVAFSLLLLPCF